MDPDDVAGGWATLDDQPRERLDDRALDLPLERTRAVERVEALFGESRHGGIVDLDEQAAAHEALAKQETADFAACHPAYDPLIESGEPDHPVHAAHEP